MQRGGNQIAAPSREIKLLPLRIWSIIRASIAAKAIPSH
jgi:hypothetical protein